MADYVTYDSVNYYPGVLFIGTATTNYTVNGQAQVTLFSGIEINRMTGRSKILTERDSNEDTSSQSDADSSHRPTW